MLKSNRWSRIPLFPRFSMAWYSITLLFCCKHRHVCDIQVHLIYPGKLKVFVYSGSFQSVPQTVRFSVIFLHISSEQFDEFIQRKLIVFQCTKFWKREQVDVRQIQWTLNSKSCQRDMKPVRTLLKRSQGQKQAKFFSF